MIKRKFLNVSTLYRTNVLSLNQISKYLFKFKLGLNSFDETKFADFFQLIIVIKVQNLTFQTRVSLKYQPREQQTLAKSDQRFVIKQCLLKKIKCFFYVKNNSDFSLV